MWSRNALTERLGLEWPIIQAPMAAAATPALAAAVSNAGGLGSLGFGTSPVAEAERQIAAFRALSNRALNVNFFCHAEPGPGGDAAEAMRVRLAPLYAARGLGAVPAPSVPYPTFGADHLALVLAQRPAIVSFHFGMPPAKELRAVKDCGAFVLSSATTVAEARWLEREGVDAVIAQGIEPGGHRGSFLDTAGGSQPGLLALVPQIVDAVRVPVIAAGGIVDGRGIAAVLALGASAVQIGTGFLRCPESGVRPAYRAALAEAREDTTVVTRLFSGRPARVLRNRLIEELHDAEDLAPPYPLQASLIMPLWRDPAAPRLAEVSPLFAGQGVALARTMPAAELVRTLAAETAACLHGLAD